ncbi:PREDICTED: uncharacterized protein LOC101303616 [Fragaria vesca subsp. vesca]|uniref:uncharacterized protein LOC101303616 n=1 Tax=Fragaria vesca subsp. vesca TaxID=101020 RepID=UPI0002C3309F|nr:PREDICTED: uncharacterized protein LOC101303616 [Fragaria vesca subsp. vesca]
MMLLFFTSRKILLGLLGLVWVVLSFLLGLVWATFSILVGSIWAAISFVVGLIWSAVPFIIVSAMIFYVVVFIWSGHAQHAIKRKEIVFSVIAACFGLLLLYRSASFSLLGTVYLIVGNIFDDKGEHTRKVPIKNLWEEF